MDKPHYWKEIHRRNSYIFQEAVYVEIDHLNRLEAWFKVDCKVDRNFIDSEWKLNVKLFTYGWF